MASKGIEYEYVPNALTYLIGTMPYQFTSFLGANDFRKISSVNKIIEHKIRNPNVRYAREQYALKQLCKFGAVSYDLSALHLEILGIHDMSEFMPYVLEFQNIRELDITELTNDEQSRITGSIPDEIGLLHNLVSLAINGHMVSTIPKRMVRMANLQYLSLWNNVILGQIPDEFFNPENSILKHSNCTIKIWKRAIRGRLSSHRGSIINYNKKHNETTWFIDDENGDLHDFDNYYSMPLLIRSNGGGFRFRSWESDALWTREDNQHTII